MEVSDYYFRIAYILLVLMNSYTRRWIDGKMELLKRYRIQDRAQLIVSLSWSPWTVTKSGKSLIT